MRFGKRNPPQDALWLTRTPLARTDELVVEEVGDEILIYDRRTDEAHCLTCAAGQVWRACDGKTPREHLGGQLGLDAGTVERALEELKACALLADGANQGITRRQATTRFVQAGAAAAAAPLIYSIVSPVPAAAQSLAACEAVNMVVAGHDCGNSVHPNGTVGCGSVPGCCCCHNMTAAPTACATAPQHCCLTAAFCLAPPPNGAGGNTCSNTGSFIGAPTGHTRRLRLRQSGGAASGGPISGGARSGGAASGGAASGGAASAP